MSCSGVNAPKSANCPVVCLSVGPHLCQDDTSLMWVKGLTKALICAQSRVVTRDSLVESVPTGGWVTGRNGDGLGKTERVSGERLERPQYSAF